MNATNCDGSKSGHPNIAGSKMFACFHTAYSSVSYLHAKITTVDPDYGWLLQLDLRNLRGSGITDQICVEVCEFESKQRTCSHQEATAAAHKLANVQMWHFDKIWY